VKLTLGDFRIYSLTISSCPEICNLILYPFPLTDTDALRKQYRNIWRELVSTEIQTLSIVKSGKTHHSVTFTKGWGEIIKSIKRRAFGNAAGIAVFQAFNLQPITLIVGRQILVSLNSDVVQRQTAKVTYKNSRCLDWITGNKSGETWHHIGES
jgi:hypothetical protein